MASSSRLGRMIGLLVALLIAPPATASHYHLGRPPVVPADEAIPPLVGPVGGAYVFRRSKGNVVFDEKCLSAINFTRLRGLAESDRKAGTGDEIICTTHLWMTDGVTVTVGTLVRRAEVREGGRVHTAVRLDNETGVCRPDSDDAWFELRATRCYEPDPTYAPTITRPFVTDPTQGFVLGDYAPRPASRLIAVEGNARAADVVQ